jgi:hypothetical protein
VLRGGWLEVRYVNDFLLGADHSRGILWEEDGCSHFFS